MMKNIKGLLAATTLLAGVGVATFGATASVANAADGDPALTTDPNGSKAAGASGVASDTQSGTGKSDVGVGFTGGDLTLDFAPNLDFGMHKALVGDTYNLATSGVAPDSGSAIGRNLIVTDARGTANSDGWNVTAQLGNFKESGAADASTNALPGTTVTINKANPIAAGTLYGTADPDGGLSTFKGFAYGRTATGEKPVVSAEDIVLDAGGTEAVKVMDAQVGAGLLTWGMDFSKTDAASIYVPISSQDVKTYTAEITWTLGTKPFS